jgi:phosphoribosylformylglycinamidine synthase
MKRVAVLQLPGSNCEWETIRVLRTVGLDAEIFRWNGAPAQLARHDAVAIPGGFAFEDRVRAGALAAKLPIMDAVAGMAADGKGVLGICNGAQILIEAGLVPALVPGRVEMALAPNENGRAGYDCRWVRIARGPKAARSILTCALPDDAIVPVPIAHAEGRFTARDESILGELENSGRVLLRYVDERGEPGADAAVNPNGSLGAIAALGNADGNVAAIMPHPERSSWMFQVPDRLDDAWGERRRAARTREALDAAGPGRAIFESVRRFLEER